MPQSHNALDYVAHPIAAREQAIALALDRLRAGLDQRNNDVSGMGLSFA